MIRLTTYRNNQSDRYKLLLLDANGIKCIEELEDVQGSRIILHSPLNDLYEYKVVQSLSTIELLIQQSNLKKLATYYCEPKTESYIVGIFDTYDYANMMSSSTRTFLKQNGIGDFNSLRNIYQNNTTELLKIPGLTNYKLNEIKIALLCEDLCDEIVFDYDIVPAEQLDISKETLRKFKELGLTSVLAIFNALNTYELLSNRSGIGKRALTEMRAALDKAGYSLTNIPKQKINNNGVMTNETCRPS